MSHQAVVIYSSSRPLPRPRPHPPPPVDHRPGGGWGFESPRLSDHLKHHHHRRYQQQHHHHHQQQQQQRQYHHHQHQPQQQQQQKSVRFLSIKPVVDERPQVQDHLKKTSVVYARSCATSQPALGARLGQRQVTQLRLKDWQRYGWTWPSLCGRSRLLPSADACSATAATTHVSSSGDLRESGDGRETSTTSTSFPPLPRPALGLPMLRRPTRRLSLRTATVGDQVLDMLGNYLDLTPVTGRPRRGKVSRCQGPRRGSRSRTVVGGMAQFYMDHFPLLLEKKAFREEDSEEEGGSKVVSHRQIQGRQTSAQKRRAELSRWCGSLERALTSLELGEGDPEQEGEGEGQGVEEEEEEEEGQEDGVFITELREDVFDPRLWPWNCERYQPV
ncbi:uncharacterized protein LOC143292123 [Babylonia areolata]|uniref:uncharacterized protein LOC143292123 n=1 Tax=Babylonia areolata TaxID=304850 RepID=UPI003FCF065F